MPEFTVTLATWSGEAKMKVRCAKSENAGLKAINIYVKETGDKLVSVMKVETCPRCGGTGKLTYADDTSIVMPCGCSSDTIKKTKENFGMTKKVLDIKEERTCTVGELRKALKGLDDNIPVGAMAWIVGARLVKESNSRRNMKEGFKKNLVWLELERQL